MARGRDPPALRAAWHVLSGEKSGRRNTATAKTLEQPVSDRERVAEQHGPAKFFHRKKCQRWENSQKWTEAGSNRRHQDFQSCALPAELSVRCKSVRSHTRKRGSRHENLRQKRARIKHRSPRIDRFTPVRPDFPSTGREIGARGSRFDGRIGRLPPHGWKGGCLKVRRRACPTANRKPDNVSASSRSRRGTPRSCGSRHPRTSSPSFPRTNPGSS